MAIMNFIRHMRFQFTRIAAFLHFLSPLIRIRTSGSFLVLVILFGGLHVSQAQQTGTPPYSGLDTLQLKTIFDQPYLHGVRPSVTGFGPQSQQLYFSWNDSSYSETGPYVTGLENTDTISAEAVSDEEARRARASVSPDNQQLAYVHDGDLYLSASDGSGARIIFAGRGETVSGTPLWSPDGAELAFMYRGDIWSLNLRSSAVRQLTQKQDDEPFYRLLAWGEGSETIITNQVDQSEYLEVLFPEYVPQMVEAGVNRRGQPKVHVKIHSLSGSFDSWQQEAEADSAGEADEDSDTITLLEGPHYIFNNDISHDGRYFLLDYTDHAMKQRRILVKDLQTGSESEIHRESTDGWLYFALLRAEFAPDSQQLFFTSERSGYSHIYTVKADGSRFRKLTEGDFEVDWASWSGSNAIIYSASVRDPGLRDVYLANTNTGSSRRLTESEAFRYDYALSRDNRYLAYLRTSWNEPADIVLLDIRRPGDEVRLTNSIPERFKRINWQQPEYIRFTGRDDSTRISMDVLKPHNFDASSDEQHPVVVFVHGAGSLQNVFQGWSRSYPREYMFHQFLNRQGYVVVEVDYRHSTGYGRKFREDVTGWMGRYELQDIVDGLNHLQERDGYLDLDRVGIYGGSYGGFMTLYALSNAPEMFSAGAALRSVTNWENYYYANPGYTRPRLGTPEEDPEHYERSSPITYADSLSRPVIMLHGLIDDNVGFQDAAQYIDRLIKSGNTDFDMMMYPSERHSYESPEAWHDQYLRIYNFFETHVK